MAAATTTLAVITGASKGIGAAIAAAAAAGATVAVCNRSATDFEHQLTADLSDPAAWAAFARPFPGRSGYCASKAAVEMWVRTVAVETTDDLVKVAAVRPGIVATDMQAEIRSSDESTFPNVERFRDLHADGALADPAEVGATIWGFGQRPNWENGSVASRR